MTVSSETNKVTYACNGGTSVFPYTFRVLDDDDISVQIKDTATGELTELAKTTDYSVSGVGDDAGGNITLVDAATDAPSGTNIIISRANLTLTQPVEYNEYDAFPASTHEEALDRATMQIQKLQEEVDRCLKVDIGSSLDSDLITPSDSAGLILKVNSTSDGFEYGTIPDTSYTFPLVGTGFLCQTGTGTATVRAVAGTNNEITVTNGDGVSGNPTLSLPVAMTFTGKTITGGTFSNPTLTGATFSSATIDNIRFATNTIDVTDSNGHLILSGNGTGEVKIGQTGTTGVRLAQDQPILDSTGNEFLKFSKTSSAVNEFTIVNNSSGNAPILKASGQANTGMTLSDSNSNEILKGTSVASAVNEFTMTNAATGIAPTFRSSGEANIGWKLQDSNGNGVLTAVSTATAVNYLAIANKTTGNAAWLYPIGDANTGFTLGDSNVNEILKLTSVASAVNEITITNAATGVAPTIRSSGESNIGMKLLDSNSNEIILGASVASAVNEITVTNAVTTAGPIIATTGGDTNADLNIRSKGTGKLKFQSGAAQNLKIDASALTAERTITFPDSDFTLGGKSMVQQVYTQTGAVATGTTAIPADNTIPQNTEGDQYMSLAITPTNASNILVITVGANATNSASTNLGIALFQDTTANALVASLDQTSAASGPEQMTLKWIMAAGTTSATTFKVRIGAATGATTTFNGSVGARYYGGVMCSFMHIQEYAV